MNELMSVDQALTQILRQISNLPSENIPLSQAYGRILAEDIYADISLPPFANSSMDGYAVHAADLAEAHQDSPVTLALTMDIQAGTAPTTPLNRGEAARIMTGAQLPPNADTVVPVEATDTHFVAGDKTLPEAVTFRHKANQGDYVRQIGEDIQKGDLILSANSHPLRPAEIGVLAALGQATVPVIRQPRVAIISTGDELIDVDQPLTAGKIRDTNIYTLTGLIQQYGGIAVRIPTARDTLEDVRRCFHEAIASKPDLILSSAGVSVGTFDFVRIVLEELGEVGFWRINMRPGKPLAFGKLNNIPFLGLPGNSVSAMVTFEIFVRPILLKFAQQPDTVAYVQAITNENLISDGRRSYLRVTLAKRGDQWVATTTGTQSSGALTSMIHADGLLIIPEGVRNIPTGTPLIVHLLKPLESLG